MLRNLSRTLFAIDTVVVLVLSYLFIEDLQYNGSAGITVWAPILAVPIGALLGGFLLHHSGRPRLAVGLLALPAIPAILFVLFFGMLLILNPSWQ